MERGKPNRLSPVIRGLASVLILAAGGGAFAMLVYKPRQELGEPPPSPPSLVVTRPVAAHDGLLDIDVDGVVVPFREITIAAEVSGRVASKSAECRAGSVVSPGTPLLEIDARDYELDVQRLTKQVAQAQASIQELYVESTNIETLIRLAEEDVELSRTELNRLLKLSAGAISETAVDQARRTELASRNALQTLRNQLQLLKSRQSRLDSSLELAAADLAKAKLDLERTRVLSPVAGVVVRESVEQDSYVQKGTTLVTIEDTSAVEVRCNLKMEQVAWLWRQASAVGLSASPQGGYQVPPTPVTVTYTLDGRTHAWPGRLARYEGIGLDEQTRTVPCRVVVENPRGAGSQPGNGPVEQGVAARQLNLVRGMYVSVHLHLTPNVPLVQVPEDAVRPGRRVWVVRDDRLVIVENLNLVSLTSVPGDSAETGSRVWLVAVQGDELQVGDRVVVSPLAYAANGVEVRERP